MGYSLGGGVALQTGKRHPERVNQFVVISALFRRSAIHPEFLAGMDTMNADSADSMLETPMYQFSSRVAPRAEDWNRLAG